jgi:hypothetical protein
MEYEFTLKFKLAPGDANADEVVERLGETGCTDALVGVGQAGQIAMDFARNAESAEKAIVGALKDVKRAIPKATLLEVRPDYVGLTEVAELVGVSRQNMRKLMLAHPESFPAAFHEANSALWHLAPVLEWVKGREGYRIEQSLLDVARIAMQINLTKAAGQIEQRFGRDVRTLIA